MTLLSACTVSSPRPPSTQAGGPSDEEAAVLAAMDRYLTAISAQDIHTMAAMQTPEGMTYRARAAEFVLGRSVQS